MITYRLVQTRRHVYQLQDGDAIAEIATHGERATVVTAGDRYDLEAIEGIRKRVVKSAQRNQTVARSSSLGHYAIDLEDRTLYWHSLPGRAYCWMNGERLIAARYSAAADGGWLIQSEADLPISALILGAYLLIHATIERAAIDIQWQPSLAFARRSR